MTTLIARKAVRKEIVKPSIAVRESTPPSAAHRALEAEGSRGPCVFNARCPSQLILERIAEKWAVLIIHKLDKKTMRFGELKREIGGISQKMLTQTLRNLEADGLVSRTVFPVVPPKVEYNLTPLGKTLLSPLGALCRWAQEHAEDIAKMPPRKGRKDRPVKVAPKD